MADFLKPRYTRTKQIFVRRIIQSPLVLLILFGLSSDEAVKAISDWRADFTRQPISQAAWLLVKGEKEAEGFNKESYHYSLSKAQRSRTFNNGATTTTDKEANYLIKLECNSLPSAESVDVVRYLPEKPNTFTSIDDDGNANEFCLLSSRERAEFLSALSKAHPSHQPDLIPVSVAPKNLSPTSLYPTLGVDTTLPQFRQDQRQRGSSPSPPPSSPPSPVRPAQDEYPVWYFFYGTLTSANILSRVIGVSSGEKENAIQYKRARVRRGRLSILGGKYLALVDADGRSTVGGWAYQVKNQNEEDSLRVYETRRYEVVRCNIEFIDGNGNGGSVHGLTFRLA
ncbi:oxidoreductase domain containing [Trichoderma cornu-damae]|uniref:Putative gamma-glutamylcyclotransferase n=1 Tax=Trichoderma cornu-damae TaxID=654480 RepID=A0A9P8QNV1_9HYPO|nr:oxidoreductase domain containing [Trichoderma cornu-damae]